MNKTIGTLLFLSPLFLLGCKEEVGIKMAIGNYTYQSSGTARISLIFAHDTIWVDPAYRDIEVMMDEAKELFHIRVGGQGYVLQNGDISLHLGYSGRSRNTDHNYTLTASDVHFNAKK